ncbi:transcriptional regulator family: Fungal Specific TF [Penicillium atrosanguineum]|nr:transcriptional regulator family: Fungal Specific TF [Penicillium atrosanguineum]
MELTWLADSPQSRSRTRALRACPACQRRKKRCRHLTANPDIVNDQFSHRSRGGVSSTFTVDDTGHRPSHSYAPVRMRTASADAALPSFPLTERFVGDLNPEAVIRERLDEPIGNPLRGRIGLWINSPTPENAGSARNKRQTAGSEPLPGGLPQSALGGTSIASVLHQRYTSALQACGPLPLVTREPLTVIYFSKVNHIIPLLERDAFLQNQAEGLTSVFLERAICLVAAKDAAASSHLHLTEGGLLQTPRQFCSEVYKGLVAAMDADLETDRLTRIRILALMSLHCEGYEGAEAASLHLCQAIHQAQTVGLHLDRPDRTSAEPLAEFFWCLWTLDKMHASIGGRPVLLADRDIGVAKPNTQTQNCGAFEVWLAISDLLATVISFYRPSTGTTSGWEEGFPAFEDIVGENAQGDLDYATLGILELYYHCVAILSCRYKLTEGLDSSKVSSIRQGLAAIRIHSIVASECRSNLPPLPIVPYAVTLSMGVSYRQLRSSKLVTHLDRAKASLEACCSLLEDLSPQWYSAEAMARLGRKALHQIDYEHQRHPASDLSASQPPTSTALAGSIAAEFSNANANANEGPIHGGTEKESVMAPMGSGPDLPMESPPSSDGRARYLDEWIRRYRHIIWRVPGLVLADEFLGSHFCR